MTKYKKKKIKKLFLKFVFKTCKSISIKTQKKKLKNKNISSKER